MLRSEDGSLHRGVRAIFAHLREREPGRFATEHRHRFAEHRDSRETDVTGQLIEYFRGTDELEVSDGPVDDAQIVHVREKSRYELRLDGRLIGLAAYRRSNDRMAITHTEVDPSCEGRGLGSRLAAAALDDAAGEGLEVAPLCPFIAYYIQKHPEYERLVAPGYRKKAS